MARFIIEELATYEVEADTAEEAEEVFLQSNNILQYFTAVEQREVYAADRQTPAYSLDEPEDDRCG